MPQDIESVAVGMLAGVATAVLVLIALGFALLGGLGVVFGVWAWRERRRRRRAERELVAEIEAVLAAKGGGR